MAASLPVPTDRPAAADLDGPNKRGDVTTIMSGAAASSFWPALEAPLAGQAYISPGFMSAVEEGHIGRQEATRQARQVERTSEVIRGGINRKVNTLVGADLRPQLTPDYRTLGQTAEWADDFARRGEAILRSWADDRRKIADAEGDYTFGGLMWLAARSITGPDGETFGIIHYDAKRAKRLNTRWATTVTVVDPQRVSTPPEHVGEDRVIDGKLVDEYGRMLGFYINKRPHGITVDNAVDTHSYVPRETSTGRPMGWHYFAKHRGAAQRGITALVNIVRRARMLDKFDNAQLGAAVVAAAMATYVKTGGDSETARENLAPASQNLTAGDFGDRIGFYDKLKLRIGPQRIPVLPLGDEIKISATDRGAADPGPFRKGFLREFASALNMTAEMLSLDYSDVNYSSARAALVDIWRGIMVERSMFASAVPALIVDAVLEEAIVKGWLELPPGGPGFYEAREAYTRCTFTGPAMGWVDPKKEAEAAQIRVNSDAPLSTLADEAAAQGKSFEELAEQRAREERYLVLLGLKKEMGNAPVPGAQPAANADPAAEPDPTSTET